MADKKQAAKPPAIILQLAVCVGISLLAIAGYQRYREKNKPEPPAPPICPGSELLELKIGDVVVGKSLSMECSTGWIRIPYGSSFYVDTGTDPELHYLFSDGSTRHVTRELQPSSRKFPTHEFRIWGKGTPTYKVLPKSR